MSAKFEIGPKKQLRRAARLLRVRGAKEAEINAYIPAFEASEMLKNRCKIVMHSERPGESLTKSKKMPRPSFSRSEKSITTERNCGTIGHQSSFELFSDRAVSNQLQIVKLQ